MFLGANVTEPLLCALGMLQGRLVGGNKGEDKTKVVRSSQSSHESTVSGESSLYLADSDLLSPTRPLGASHRLAGNYAEARCNETAELRTALEASAVSLGMSAESAGTAPIDELTRFIQTQARDLAAAAATQAAPCAFTTEPEARPHQQHSEFFDKSNAANSNENGDSSRTSQDDNDEDSDGVDWEEAGLLRSLLAAREQRIRALECLQEHGQGGDDRIPLEPPVDAAAVGPPGEGTGRAVADGPLAASGAGSEGDSEREEMALIIAERGRLTRQLEELQMACDERRGERERLLQETEEARSQYERASKVLTELNCKAREKRSALEELERQAAKAAAVAEASRAAAPFALSPGDGRHAYTAVEKATQSGEKNDEMRASGRDDADGMGSEERLIRMRRELEELQERIANARSKEVLLSTQLDEVLGEVDRGRERHRAILDAIALADVRLEAQRKEEENLQQQAEKVKESAVAAKEQEAGVRNATLEASAALTEVIFCASTTYEIVSSAFAELQNSWKLQNLHLKESTMPSSPTCMKSQAFQTFDHFEEKSLGVNKVNHEVGAVAMLEEQLQSCIDRLAHLQDERDALERELVLSRSMPTELTLAELAEATVRRERVVSLEAQESELQATIDELEAEGHVLRGSNAVLVSAISRAQAKEKELRGMLEGLAREVAEMEEKRQDLQSHLMDSRFELQVLRQQVADANADLRRLQSSSSAAADECLRHEHTAIGLWQDVENSEQEVGRAVTAANSSLLLLLQASSSIRCRMRASEARLAAVQQSADEGERLVERLVRAVEELERAVVPGLDCLQSALSRAALRVAQQAADAEERAQYRLDGLDSEILQAEVRLLAVRDELQQADERNAAACAEVRGLADRTSKMRLESACLVQMEMDQTAKIRQLHAEANEQESRLASLRSQAVDYERDIQACREALLGLRSDLQRDGLSHAELCEDLRGLEAEREVALTAAAQAQAHLSALEARVADCEMRAKDAEQRSEAAKESADVQLSECNKRLRRAQEEEQRLFGIVRQAEADLARQLSNVVAEVGKASSELDAQKAHLLDEVEMQAAASDAEKEAIHLHFLATCEELGSCKASLNRFQDSLRLAVAEVHAKKVEVEAFRTGLTLIFNEIIFMREEVLEAVGFIDDQRIYDVQKSKAKEHEVVSMREELWSVIEELRSVQEELFCAESRIGQANAKLFADQKAAHQEAETKTKQIHAAMKELDSARVSLAYTLHLLLSIKDPLEEMLQELRASTADLGLCQNGLEVDSISYLSIEEKLRLQTSELNRCRLDHGIFEESVLSLKSAVIHGLGALLEELLAAHSEVQLLNKDAQRAIHGTFKTQELASILLKQLSTATDQLMDSTEDVSAVIDAEQSTKRQMEVITAESKSTRASLASARGLLFSVHEALEEMLQQLDSASEIVEPCQRDAEMLNLKHDSLVEELQTRTNALSCCRADLGNINAALGTGLGALTQELFIIHSELLLIDQDVERSAQEQRKVQELANFLEEQLSAAMDRLRELAENESAAIDAEHSATQQLEIVTAHCNLTTANLASAQDLLVSAQQASDEILRQIRAATVELELCHACDEDANLHYASLVEELLSKSHELRCCKEDQIKLTDAANRIKAATVTELSELSQDLFEAHSMAVLIEQEVQYSSQAHRNTKALADSLQRQLISAQDGTNSAIIARREAEAKLAAARCDLQAAFQSIGSFREELSAAGAEIEVANAAMDKANSELSDVREEHKSAYQNLILVQQNLAQAKYETQVIAEELILSREELCCAREELKTTNLELKAAKETLQSYNEAQASTIEDLHSSQKQVVAATDELESLRKNLFQTHNDLQEAKADFYRVEESLKSARSDLLALEETRNIIKQEVQSIEENLCSSKSCFDSTKQELMFARQELQLAERQLSATQAALEATLEEATCSKEQVQSFQHEIMQQEQRLCTMEEERLSLEQAIEEARVTLCSIEELVVARKSALSTAQSDVIDVEKQVATAKSELHLSQERLYLTKKELAVAQEKKYSAARDLASIGLQMHESYLQLQLAQEDLCIADRGMRDMRRATVHMVSDLSIARAEMETITDMLSSSRSTILQMEQELAEKLAMKRREVDAKTAELAHLRGEEETAKELIESLHGELLAANRRLDLSAREFENLRSEQEPVVRELSALQKCVEDARKELTRLDGMVLSSQSRLVTCNEKLVSVQHEILLREETLKKVGQDVASRERELDAATASLRSVQDLQTSTNSDLASTSARLNEAMRELAFVSGQLELARSDVDATNAEIEAGKKDLDSVLRQLHSNKQELISVSSQLITSRNQLDRSQQQLLVGAKEIESAQVELSAKTTLLHAVEQDLSTRAAMLTACERDLASKLEQLASTDRDLASSRAQLAEADEELLIAEARREQACKERLSMASELDEMRTDLASTADRLAAARCDLASKEQQRELARQRLESAAGELSATRSALLAAQRELSSAEQQREVLLQDASTAVANLEARRQEALAIEARIQVLERDHALKAEQVRNCEEYIARSSRRLDEVQQNQASAAERLETTRRETFAASELLRASDMELSLRRRMLETASCGLAWLAGELRDVASGLQAEACAMDDKRLELLSSLRQLASIQTDGEDASRQLLALRRELLSASGSLETTRHELKIRASELTAMETACKSAAERLAAIEAEKTADAAQLEEARRELAATTFRLGASQRELLAGFDELESIRQEQRAACADLEMIRAEVEAAARRRRALQDELLAAEDALRISGCAAEAAVAETKAAEARLKDVEAAVAAARGDAALADAERDLAAEQAQRASIARVDAGAAAAAALREEEAARRALAELRVKEAEAEGRLRALLDQVRTKYLSVLSPHKALCSCFLDGCVLVYESLLKRPSICFFFDQQSSTSFLPTRCKG